MTTIVIASLLVLVFSYAAASKLSDPALYSYDMAKQPLPAWLQTLALWLLPALEIACCGLLLVRKTRLAGFGMAAVLMFVFTTYTALALSGRLGTVPCSCGGVIRTLNWPQHLWLNTVFLVLSVTGIFLARHSTFFMIINRRRRKPVTE